MNKFNKNYAYYHKNSIICMNHLGKDNIWKIKKNISFLYKNQSISQIFII